MTVAVIDPGCAQRATVFDRRQEADFKIEWFNGTIKAGGQHHQKNATCCRITHLPSGIMKSAQTRSRLNSEKEAMASLLATLDAGRDTSRQVQENTDRRAQAGTGERGNKRRTYRFQDGLVIDHKTGKRAKPKDVLKGKFNLLWV